VFRDLRQAEIVGGLLLLAVACSPSGGGGEAPAFLEVAPGALTFEPEQDSATLLVKNTGDEAATFDVQVSATANGVSWLTVDPMSGALDGRDAVALSVTVRNRADLVPGEYSGTISVQGLGLEPILVPLVMRVGQPILEVTPAGELAFGAEEVSATLVVKNKGTGVLAYSLKLPGPWITTDADPQKEIRSNEPQTVSLVVDRAKASWYGEGGGDLVISSNGLDDAEHSGTVTIPVKVAVDDSCEVDANCLKEGHYCEVAEGAGRCVPVKADGMQCGGPSACVSGLCEQGFCCFEPCADPCRSCGLPGQAGKCAPVSDGTKCEDGQACTEGTTCQGGTCGGGAAPDCSAEDTECSEGVCDETAGGCVEGPLFSGWCRIDGACVEEGTASPDSSCLVCAPGEDPDGWSPNAETCIIQGMCHGAGDANPEHPCLKCIPGLDRLDWSPVSGSCFIDGKCYAMDEPVEGECLVCNPEQPEEASPAAAGQPCGTAGNACVLESCDGQGACITVPQVGSSCNDDNPCTKEDACNDESVCSGVAYPCEDGLVCTVDECDGEGGCVPAPPIVEGNCLIDGSCLADGFPHPKNPCMACRPLVSTTGWSEREPDSPCDDGDACTYPDVCMAGGTCGGVLHSCDDGIACTVDSCVDAGECLTDVAPGWCFIADKCIEAATASKENACLVCAPDVSKTDWSAAPQGTGCDDGSANTKGDVCAGDGTCKGEYYECPEQPACVTSQANGMGGCTTTVTEGFCLINGSCRAEGEPNPQDPCESCQPDNLQAAWSPTNEGKPCDDGLFCTAEDQCGAGVCAGILNECGEYKTECLDAVCLEGAKTCFQFEIDDGTACDDADPCSLDDQCESGACVGTAKECGNLAQGNPCLKAFCDAQSTPVAGECVTEDLPDGTACDDGLFCKVDEKCVAGECKGTSKVCETKLCAIGTCDEAAGACTYKADPATVGKSCDDQDACTDGTVCTALATCGAGDPVTPDECSANLGNSNPCMVGQCDEATGCSVVAAPNGQVCTIVNAQAQCLDGVCTLIKCQTGFGDCNGNKDDGCEQDLLASATNCGECKKTCEVAGGTGKCVAGKCAVASCPTGTGDCDGLFANGCETDITSELAHCGKCNSPCVKGTFFQHAQVECLSSTCTFLGCDSGYEDANKTCGSGKSCFDGCEMCLPLADGMTDIPDNGKDEDCDLMDSTNDEAFGYYVDGCFSFGAGCPLPGTGTRACPFSTVGAAVAAAQAQSWTDPTKARREIYIAQCDYWAAGPVASTTRPLALLGGYVRSPQGPWTLVIDSSKTVLTADSGAWGIELKATGMWPVVHNLKVGNSGAYVDGKAAFVGSHIGGNGIHFSSTVPPQGWIESCKVDWCFASNCLNGDGGAFYIVDSTFNCLYFGGNCQSAHKLLRNKVTDFLQAPGKGSVFMENVVGGNVEVLQKYGTEPHNQQFIANTVTGAFKMGGGGGQVVRNSTLGSLQGCVIDWTVKDCAVLGDVNFGCNGSGGGDRKLYLTGNSVQGNVLGFQSSGGHTLVGNTIKGNVVGFPGGNGTSGGAYAGVFSLNKLTGSFTNARGPKVYFVGNDIGGSVTSYYDDKAPYDKYGTDDWVVLYNRFGGQVQLDAGATVVGNSFFAPGNPAWALEILGKYATIANNVFLWGGTSMQDRTAVRFTSDWPQILRNNAFFMFNGTAASLIALGGGKVTDVEVLNASGAYLPCGNGGNIAFSNKADGHFVSVTPGAADLLTPTADSPTVDAGLALPFTCQTYSIAAQTKDLANKTIPCGNGFDIGAYEWCE
jgi:hypothetical protein